MKNKNDKHIFWQWPPVAIFILFSTLLLLGFLIIGVVHGPKIEYARWLYYLVACGGFCLATVAFLICGFRFYWLRIVIDSDKILVKLLSGKALTECRISQIVEVQVRQIPNMGLFVIIKDGRKAKSNKVAQKNGYVAFKYSRKKEAVLKTYWSGNIRWLH